MWERFNFRTGKLLTSGHTISFLRIFESCRLLWINPINGDASEITMWSVAGVATKLRMKAKIERRKIQPVHSKTLSFICTTVKLPLKFLPFLIGILVWSCQNQFVPNVCVPGLASFLMEISSSVLSWVSCNRTIWRWLISDYLWICHFFDPDWGLSFEIFIISS